MSAGGHDAVPATQKLLCSPNPLPRGLAQIEWVCGLQMQVELAADLGLPSLANNTVARGSCVMTLDAARGAARRVVAAGCSHIAVCSGGRHSPFWADAVRPRCCFARGAWAARRLLMVCTEMCATGEPISLQRYRCQPSHEGVGAIQAPLPLSPAKSSMHLVPTLCTLTAWQIHCRMPQRP